ncbi:hypothetical protein [Brevundimonas sanguinis]|uniref:hypothetical protein n=1 Tax=Brevundimonas sanguinis TaxID=3021811 RepID=UPI0024158765|nr:hypothetical protein [Brevundimonas sp. NCCP 15609]
MTTPRVTVPVEPLWMMHVIGPDDIYPAPDHATAVEWCAYLNSEIAPKVPSVLCVAVPAIWTGTAEEHAEGMPEAIRGWSRPPAAPAPEGGAVSKACVDFQEAIDDFEADVADVMAEGSERADLWDREITVNIDALKTVMSAALATREEAPAEDDARRKLIQCIEQWDGETEYDADDLTSLADSILHAFNGPPVVLRADPVQLSSNPCQLAVATSSEASPCPFCGCGMRVNYDPESEMYGPDGDHLPGCIIGNWDLHEYAFRPDALAAWNSRALRAQPPAREDAQPVGIVDGLIGRLNTAELDDGTPLYTHPAPDALRVAVEALEEIADTDPDDGTSWFHERANQALAALQAEQGAK